LPDGGIWDRYWRCDRIASCFDGAGARNYDESIAAGWGVFFETLPRGARILDLCAGNGAAALIAAQAGRAGARDFEIVAVDRADIDPPAFVTRHGEDYAAIRFLGKTSVEALPFADGGFDAVISQFGIEYADPAAALAEAVRVLAPGGRIRFVVHAAEGVVAAGARAMIADADLLLDTIDLPGAARRCFERVSSAERDADPNEEARRRADESFAAFQTALERTARHVPHAADRVMLRNSGAVLLDTFQRRTRLSLDQLLAKAEEVEAEIRAHRGRLQALLDAALDAKGAEAIADRLSAAGAIAASRPLSSDDGLIGHVVAARLAPQVAATR
jgi:SAM-dependent methyltransferase